MLRWPSCKSPQFHSRDPYNPSQHCLPALPSLLFWLTGAGNSVLEISSTLLYIPSYNKSSTKLRLVNYSRRATMQKNASILVKLLCLQGFGWGWVLSKKQKRVVQLPIKNNQKLRLNSECFQQESNLNALS